MSYIACYQPRTLLREVNNIIEKAFNPVETNNTSEIEASQWIPAVDLRENKNQFIIYADLPGVNKEDIHISMENNILTLKGERSVVKKEEKENTFRTERVRGNFYRRFSLPDTADGSRIEAKMKQGVLEIVIPKKEASQARVIEVHSDD